MLTRAVLAALFCLALSPALAHWETDNADYAWATPGQMRWLIDYSKLEKPHVQLMLDAQFNLLQGGSFTPDALALLKGTPGTHSMQYICSRTIYHEQLFPKYPELKDAAIRNPDGSYKIIYNNPARYAGCWNQPAWLAYVKARMDDIHRTGVDTIFFDNPMTWACYCPRCQELFTAFAREKTGQALRLGQFGRPTELENWFTLDTAVRFWTQIHAYARGRAMFIVANNLTYWLVNQGLTDGVFSEAGGHPPFQQDLAAYKIGLAASHGKPTGVLDYIPQRVMMARGKQQFNNSQGSGQKWVGAPVAEEFELGTAQGLACGGNYLANYCLELGRRVELMTDPEDARIQAAVTRYGRFIVAHPEVYAAARPGAPVAVLYSLTRGPREGEILGMNRGSTNALLWRLQAQGVPAEVIVESDLTPERLAGLKAIVVDDVAVLEPAAAEALRRFVEQGGILIVGAPGKVRGRFEAPERARPLSSYFPEAPALSSFSFTPTDAQLQGYQLEANRLKVEKEGTASFAFSGPAGSYRVLVPYLDESDGQGSFALRVDGREVGTWRSDRDDDGMHDYLSPLVPLQPGAQLTVWGQAQGGEYGRLFGLRVYSDEGQGVAPTTLIRKGRITQSAMALTRLAPPDATSALSQLRNCGVVFTQPAWPQKLLLNLTRCEKRVYLHLVNYDFVYDDKYVLQQVRPTPPLRLLVPVARRARLLSPDEESRGLMLHEGVLEVPPVRVYSVVELQ